MTIRTARAWFRLARVPLAPTAAWDATAGLALGLAAAGRPLGAVPPQAWALLALTALCLYGAGMIGNDWADRRRDRELAPDRPLPSGAVGPRAAGLAALALVALAVAVGGGPAGSREAVVAAALAAAAYDLGLKRALVPGAFAMGFVRFANAATGVVPLVVAGFASPLALLGPLAVGLYAAGVTVWSTTEDLPEHAVLGRRVAARVLLGAAFALAGTVPWWAALQLAPDGRPILAPLLAFGGFTSVLFARTPRPGPPKRQVLEMLLGLYFLSACLAAAGDGGTLVVNLAAFGTALLLIWASQMLVRSLSR